MPYRFKDVMEKDEGYPAGWKHRKIFRSRNDREKRPRLDQAGSVEQQVLQEQQQVGREEEEEEDRRKGLLEDRMTAQHGK